MRASGTTLERFTPSSPAAVRTTVDSLRRIYARALLAVRGSRAVSTWRLASAQQQFPSFDYDTIADVVLHIRYTARGDGGLKAAAEDELQTVVNAVKTAANESGASRLFSLKQEFPTEWHRLRRATYQVIVRRNLPSPRIAFHSCFRRAKTLLFRNWIYTQHRKLVRRLPYFQTVTVTSPQGECSARN